MVEECLDRTFSKYVNNDWSICTNNNTELQEKAECLAHYSFVKSKEQLRTRSLIQWYLVFGDNVEATEIYTESCFRRIFLFY